MIGSIICNRYKIIDHLGTGGMATVWLAEDTILNRQVAVKTFKIDSNDEDAIKRFNREANAVTSLSHPNIVSIYGVENEDNFYYLILEYVHGMTLKDYMLQNKNIPVETAVYIIKQIASGLSHAHKNGIIHRDIKPQNILMTEDLTCKITDFGISRAYGDTTLTQTNQMLGTVYYLSPEQARGNVATAQSDIYSLGILMFELLTGKIPFKGESAVAIALKHLQEDLPNIDNYRSNIPQSVKNIVIKSTMKNPNERYISSKELTDDLETSLDINRRNESTYKGFAAFSNENNYEKTILQNSMNSNNANDVNYQEDNYQSTFKPNPTYPNYTYSEEQKNNKKSPIIKIIIAISLFILSLVGLAYTYNYYSSSSKTVVPDVRNMTLTEAKAELKKAELVVGEVTEVASDTVKKDVIISSDPSSGKKVAKGETVNLRVSSGKATITMPNFLGMTEDQVKSSIEKSGFKNVIFEKSESDDYESGKVMAQNIVAGSEIVPKDTSLTITISSGAKKIQAPNLINVSLSDAYKKADELGLQIRVESYEYDSKIPENQIIKQNVSEGTELKKGDTISVIVSKGKEPLIKITVPTLIGNSLNNVKSWASQNDLKLDILYSPSSSKTVGTVLSQSIRPGDEIEKGSEILISVSGSETENN